MSSFYLSELESSEACSTCFLAPPVNPTLHLSSASLPLPPGFGTTPSQRLHTGSVTAVTGCSSQRVFANKLSQSFPFPPEPSCNNLTLASYLGKNLGRGERCRARACHFRDLIRKIGKGRGNWGEARMQAKSSRTPFSDKSVAENEA